MHGALEAIRRITAGTGFEGQVWLVGGAVRDSLLGLPEPSDFDLVTELSSAKLAQMLFDTGISAIAPVTYPRFGTAMVQVLGAPIEIVTARAESYAAGSRKPEVAPATLADDAKRRDFTVNTLLRNLHTGQILDPLGCGVRDLEGRVLRTPLEPRATFSDDPLRMLRAVRFRWQIGLTPTEGLYAAVRAERERLKIISHERIQDELNRMLLLEDADRCLSDLLETGLLSVLAPEIEAMVGTDQRSDYHYLDVWEHTLLVLRVCPNGDLCLRLAALLHDVGKPPTRSLDSEGRIRFFGHEREGEILARRFLRRLKYPNELTDTVCLLVRNHMRLTGFEKWTPAASRRLVRDLGENLERLFSLVDADRKGHRGGVPDTDIDMIRASVEAVTRKSPPSTWKSPLSGEEIQKFLGIGPGPEVGRWKAFLLEEVIAGRLTPGDGSHAKEMLLTEISDKAKRRKRSN